MVEEIPLPCARLGTRRVLAVHRFGTPGARPKAYLQAALHADETPGMLVAHHLIHLLRKATVSGEVVVVPVANPVGLAQVVEGTHVGRYALDGGGNFNRQFPDLTDAAAERLTGALVHDPVENVRLVRAALRAAHAGLTPVTEVAALRHALLGLALDADFVLDLHCDQEAVPHLYTGEALWPALSDVAGELGCEAVLLERDSGGTPFDEACSGPWWHLAGRFGSETPVPPGCAAATVELRGKADVSDVLAEADARALLRVLVRRGVVAGEAAPPPPACEATPLAGLERLTAPRPGVIAFHRVVGERVAPGDLVAEIVDPTAADPAQARTPLRAGVAGLVMARSNRRFAGMGELVASIAGREPLQRTGRGLLFD